MYRISRRKKKRSEFALPDLWLVIPRCGALLPIVHLNEYFSTGRAISYTASTRKIRRLQSIQDIDIQRNSI